jgi:hypothetical protein
MEPNEFDPYNVVDVEDMPYRHWWFKAHNRVTRKVWDILILAWESEDYHWRCSGVGGMGTGSAKSLEDAKHDAVEYARAHEPVQ